MLVDPPASGIEAEIVDGRYRLEIERSIAVGERDVDAVVAEPDDVLATVASDVGEKAWMPVDAPSSSIEAQVVDDRYRLEVERAVAVAQRDVEPVVAESDDVRATVAGDVGEKSRVPVDAPAARFEAEVRQHEARFLERAVPVSERDPNAVVAEADDVGAPLARDIREEARVPVDAPAPRFDAKRGQHESNGSER